jgi:hypothetical protein
LLCETIYSIGSRAYLLLRIRHAQTTILVVFNSTCHMRFAIVTSSISAALIAVVSALSVVVLSWVYPAVQSHDQGSDVKTEISWGQGS